MRSCHSCPHNEAVQSGKYKDVEFEKTPCASCPGEETPAFVLEYDDDRMPVDAVAEIEVEEPSLPVSLLGEVVTILMSMPGDVRDVVCMRKSGLKYAEIAKRQGVTMAAVEAKHRRAIRKWPIIQTLFMEKVAKQDRRKPHKRRAA